MTTLYFDEFGFLCEQSSSIGGTTEPLPRGESAETASWNWNGFEWIKLPIDYKVPVPTGTNNHSVKVVLTFEQQREQSLLKIDTDADLIYQTVVGNRLSEYTEAESDALAFKAAEYEGPIGRGVSTWAAAKGKSAQWAADDIIQQASDWRAAQGNIRFQRLSKKELIRNCISEEELAKIMKEWAQFVVVIRNALKIPITVNG